MHRVAARVGLVGNPSDGFGGAVLSTIVPGLQASVTATESDGVLIVGPDITEQWPSLAMWWDDVASHGAHGEQRIVIASLFTLVEHVRRTRPDRAGRSGLTISWRTGIPRSVGLAGSSALAVATIDAVSTCWELSLDRRVCAALALSAERDVLGIAAGWQDRIVQAFGRTILVDTASMNDVDGVSVPHVLPVDPGPVWLVVGWNEELASSSDSYHAPLQRDPDSLTSPMAELAAVARRAAANLERGDVHAFASAVDEGWRIRQSCVPLHPDHAALVELVRAAGVAATTPGSGGSVVAVCPDRDAVDQVRAALVSAACESVDFAVTH